MDSRKLIKSIILLIIYGLLTSCTKPDEGDVIFNQEIEKEKVTIESRILKKKPERSELTLKINDDVLGKNKVPGIKDQKILHFDYDKKGNRIMMVYQTHLTSYDENGKIMKPMTGNHTYVYLIDLSKKNVDSSGSEFCPWQEKGLSSDVGCNGKVAKYEFIGTLSEGNAEARAYYWIYESQYVRELLGYDYIKVNNDQFVRGYNNLLPKPKGPYDDKPIPSMEAFQAALNSPDSLVRENMLSDNLGRHFPREYVDVMIPVYFKETDIRNRGRFIRIIMNSLTIYGKPANLKMAMSFAEKAIEFEKDPENYRKLTNSVQNIQTNFNTPLEPQDNAAKTE